MSGTVPTWSQGLQILRRRQTELPHIVLESFDARFDDKTLDLSRFRSVVTTGVGSSAANARYLARILSSRSNIPAWDVSSGEFLYPPRVNCEERALVVFSQGLSPNARVPLAWSSHFGRTLLVTAALSEPGERAAAAERFRQQGVIVVPMPVQPEYEVLLRIIGPAVGYVMALRIAAASGIPLEIDGQHVAEAMSAAMERTKALIRTCPDRAFDQHITFVAAGGYGALAANLCAKVTEGMFLAPPVAVDAIELAHGFSQEAAGKSRTFIALLRKTALEAQLFARARTTLQAQHLWIDIESGLPDPFEIFEHEAAMNEIVLGAIARRRLDQLDWPGKGSDTPLYSVSSIGDLRNPFPAPVASLSSGNHLSALTWSEIETRIESGQNIAVLPLGATEQHGPHLPLCVDSIIAGALAERFCERIPGSILLPVLPLGISTEHMDFAGTLSLEPQTLKMVLQDLVRALLKHGFRRVVIFSAHGGNDSLLRKVESHLSGIVETSRLTVIGGIERVQAEWAAASRQEGIPPEMSGLHAGEFETSIIAGLRPDLVRWHKIEEGLLSREGNSESLFYPSLKRNASNGVVGNPCAASAARAERYLEAWVDLLIAQYKDSNATTDL